MKVFSFFSGGGFLDLGFENSGFEIVLVNEFNRDFLRIYKYSRENMGIKAPLFGYCDSDITDFLKDNNKKNISEKIRTLRKNNELIGFIGGPPCPDFSVAGKNKGIKGDNGKLTTVYKRLIIEQQPDFFLLENVKGFWSTQKHKIEYEKLKRSLERAGYITMDSMLNSLEYGVPQFRERIFLIGIKKSLFLRKEQIIDFKNHFEWGRDKRESLNSILQRPWPETEEFMRDSNSIVPRGLREDLTVNYWFEKNNVMDHFNSNDAFKPKSEKFYTVLEGDTSKKSFKRLHRWRFSPTAAYGNNEVHLHPFLPRRLSVSEALAIQSLPKEYIIQNDISLTKMFKLIGNGVPYLMSKGIAEELYLTLSKLEQGRFEIDTSKHFSERY